MCNKDDPALYPFTATQMSPLDLNDVEDTYVN